MKSKAVFAGFYLLLFSTGLISAAPRLEAHERTYAFNEEYRTLPKGSFELESHTRFKMPDARVTDANTWEFQEEFEYGVTDRWTIAHYQIWQVQNRDASNDDNGTYKGFKFETKYRIGEKGQYWLDPLLYLEWQTAVRDHDNPNSIEGKVVLSKDFGLLNINYNQIIESKLGSGGRTEHAYTVGTNYEIFEGVRPGVELKGTYWTPSSNRNELAVGPSLAWSNRYFWISGGVLFGANRAADDIQSRVIVGFSF